MGIPAIQIDMRVDNIILVAILAMAIPSCRGTSNTGSDVDSTEAVADKKPATRHLVDIDRRSSLTIYTPLFTRVDLVTGTMPSKDEKDVIMCFEAAFTGELLDEFKHSNIAGNHVSSGVFYKGYKCGPNNGVFTWDSKRGWHFYNYSHTKSEAVLKTAADNGGMGFGQSLLIHEGRRFKGCFKAESENIYRALCELDDKLCVIDCTESMPFGRFLDALMDIGVREAIYCDMGYGWNYSWYRQDNGTVKELFHVPGRYTTNWVTFYREGD